MLGKYPDIERAHRKLWDQNTAVLKEVVNEAVREAVAHSKALPQALVKLLPTASNTSGIESEPPVRDTIFIIKASPIDDEFTLWLAPKLEGDGYKVFADILTLQPGDRWRREIMAALRHRAAKVLLLCRNTTLDDGDIQDDIEIAMELSKELGDGRFVLPLRMEAFRKIKGLADADPIDFVRSWGEGLIKLLATLQRQQVPRDLDGATIDPNWEVFCRRGTIPIVDEPERLTSN